MHKEELKDEVKNLFGDFTECEYLNYFTSRFPRLLFHCYNAVEKKATNLLAEYFYEDASAQAQTAAIGICGIELEGSELTINCKDDITFPEKKVEIDTLEIQNISNLFSEQNKSFTNFLQKNASNITKLEFNEGSLKFDSMNKVLQKLPNLQEIEFWNVKYEAFKTNQTIQPTTCKNLVELEIEFAKNSILFQAFQECQTMQKLTVHYSKVNLEEIVQIYPNLEELEVRVNDDYPVSDQHEANSRIHQLKVLAIELWTKNEKIQEKLIISIQKLNNLRQFQFDSYDYSLSQSLCQQLAAHICQLERLTSLKISDKHLLKEVETFAANCRVANTCLEEFKCQLSHFSSLPSSFLAHFTNLRKLDIDCEDAEETKMEDLISFMHKIQLTSIGLWRLPSACFQQFQQLKVDSLQVLVIHINNRNQDEVAAFDILQEFLPRHPNITEFGIGFFEDYDEPKSLELIPMILATLPKLERLEVEKCPKTTPDAIKQIAALETLKSLQINEHDSETFYKT